MTDVLPNSPIPQSAPTANRTTPRRLGSRISSLGYLGLGLLANTIIWGLAAAYLNLSPKNYVSEWGVKVLGNNSGVDVTLPEGWRASSGSNNSKPLVSEDPRSDYVYLIQSPDIRKAAASAVGIPVDDFGDLKVTTDSQSTIIGLAIDGKTPEQAQNKANALYSALDRRVSQLRQAEVLRRKKETEASLESARQKVDRAQGELAGYQASSGLNADSQIQDLASGIEQMRQQYAQTLAQEKGAGSQVQQLTADINASSAGAADSYQLQSDPVYQNQFKEYGVAAAAYADLSAQLGDQHPQVVAKRAEVQGLATALENRGSFLLGRPVNQATLSQLAPLSLDPRVEASRGALFQEAVSGRANQSGLQSQSQELANQMALLENRLAQLSQDQFKVNALKRNLQSAETLYASALTTLNLSGEDIYSIYPPVQLAAEPTLPAKNKYTSPNPTIAIGGALAASFLVTTGLLLLWTNAREPREAYENDFPFRV